MAVLLRVYQALEAVSIQINFEGKVGSAHVTILVRKADNSMYLLEIHARELVA